MLFGLSTLYYRFSGILQHKYAVLVIDIYGNFHKAVFLVAFYKIGDGDLAGQHIAGEHRLQPPDIGGHAGDQGVAEEADLQILAQTAIKDITPGAINWPNRVVFAYSSSVCRGMWS